MLNSRVNSTFCSSALFFNGFVVFFLDFLHNFSVKLVTAKFWIAINHLIVVDFSSCVLFHQSSGTLKACKLGICSLSLPIYGLPYIL